MGTHPIFESDFDCLTEKMSRRWKKSQDHFHGLTSLVREKMDRQYLQDTRQLKDISTCYRSAKNLYEQVVRVEKEHRRQGAVVEDLIYRARALYKTVDCILIRPDIKKLRCIAKHDELDKYR